VRNSRADSSTSRVVAAAALEITGAVAAATGLVALLDAAAPIAGLGVIYLLAVLLVAVRRGEPAALVTAFLSVLTLNYFFIEPRHRLTIADSENVVALIVFLIVAIVVGRLAATARQRATEAEERAHEAAAREAEAKILAAAASAVLESDLESQLAGLQESVQRASAGHLRIEMRPANSGDDAELAVPLGSRTRSAWLHGSSEAGIARGDLERMAEPLGRLVDVASERKTMVERQADAEVTRRADATKTALLHAISHDLRSPLTAIATAAGGLRSDISLDDRRALLQVIDGETTRLARLVDDLLDLSRIEAAAIHPQTDWCDLGEVASTAAAHVLGRSGEHQIEFDLPGDLPLVQADAAQLERVFSNLIENAVRFSPPDEPVRISGGSGGGRVILRVTDHGPGIPTGRQQEIFEPFSRGRDNHQGSGLGLAICRGFVEANGGRIQLQSTPGRGTSFAVSFPLVAQPATVA
jgi:two-component system, OmpR family, sensor histidine kinase KdpD